jgi:hypothetical protein
MGEERSPLIFSRPIRGWPGSKEVKDVPSWNTAARGEFWLVRSDWLPAVVPDVTATPTGDVTAGTPLSVVLAHPAIITSMIRMVKRITVHDRYLMESTYVQH